MSRLSPSNTELQALRRLSRRRSARSETGIFLIDGPTLIAEAIDSSAKLDRVYVEPNAMASEVVWKLRDAAVPIVEVTDGALAKVLDLNAPQMMVAVAPQKTETLEHIVADARDQRRPFLVLVELSDPGNLGTLIRAAEAFGCVGVVLTEETVDLFNPKTVRSTAGSLFRMNICVAAPVDKVFDCCDSSGISTWASVVQGGTDIYEAEIVDSAALFIGSEAHGLSGAVLDRCDHRLSILMDGGTESLNAGVAGSVIMFEAARQRRSR